MSYILDALKKADAERERGQGRAPGLHARPAPMVDDPAEPATRSLGAAAWVIAGLLGALIVVLGWRLWAPTGAPQPAQAVAVVPAEPALPPAPQRDSQPARVMPGAPAIEPSVPPPPAPPRRTDTAGLGEGRARSAEPAPDAAGSRGATPAPSAAASASTAPAQRAARPAEVASRPAEGPPLYTPQTLPEAVRRDLPAVAVSGAMYSETPAQRMLIINSQVFREGDQPLPGLVLEEIRLKSAVFGFRGHRVLIAY